MAFVPIYIVILGFTIVIDYIAGIYIEKTNGRKRKLFLICSLAANILVLAIFKYYNFFNETLDAVLLQFNHKSPFDSLKMLLPIGLSFHTFQAMSYTIEVYRGKQPAERNFGIYALYVMFYPQLVAGPIERPQNVLHQFYEKHKFKAENISEGLKLIAWGLFKKVVIADRFAIIVNKVYNDPKQFEGLPLLFATFLFAFQIYCDFSGYSDIALGTARTIGFRLMKNFDSPYFSTSISQFWKRWHISLSTWFRDYLYIPLGGSRVNQYRWYFNLFITFLVSGLWHGANWTYVVWGSLNGLYLIFEHSTKQFWTRICNSAGLSGQIRSFLGLISTFGLTCFAWIFFRAKTVQDAYYIISHLFTNLGSSISYLKPSALGSTQYDYIIGIWALLVLLTVERVNVRMSVNGWIMRQSFAARMTIYYMFIMFILLFGMFDVQEQFIYFQF